MFTGIIEEKGKIKRVIEGRDFGSIEISASKVLEGTMLGDSIAVNGVCLTVTGIKGSSFTADVMPETLRRTNLGTLNIGSEVNLERTMSAMGRFGGHIVSGHIDGTGKLTSLKAEGNAVWLTVGASPQILRGIVEKGSICIDGVSLTVAYVDEEVFKVSIIPHTGEETTLLKKKSGDIVNLENDIVGKYVEKLLQPYGASSSTGGGAFADSRGHGGADNVTVQSGKGITLDFLIENGF